MLERPSKTPERMTNRPANLGRVFCVAEFDKPHIVQEPGSKRCLWQDCAVIPQHLSGHRHGHEGPSVCQGRFKPVAVLKAQTCHVYSVTEALVRVMENILNVPVINGMSDESQLASYLCRLGLAAYYDAATGHLWMGHAVKHCFCYLLDLA